jgi:hypothetical protein
MAKMRSGFAAVPLRKEGNRQLDHRDRPTSTVLPYFGSNTTSCRAESVVIDDLPPLNELGRIRRTKLVTGWSLVVGCQSCKKALALTADDSS